jgi:hypothetical protein
LQANASKVIRTLPPGSRNLVTAGRRLKPAVRLTSGCEGFAEQNLLL